jgi:hypothetical protein
MRYSEPISALAVFIAVIALTTSASCQIRPTNGIDSYGQGLTYPGVYGDRSVSAAAFAGNILAAPPLFAIDMKHDLQMQLLSRWAVPGYVPVTVNLSGQGWHMARIFGQITAAGGLTLPEVDLGKDRDQPAIEGFTRSEWEPEESDYQVPALNDFMDEGWQSQTGHHQAWLSYDPSSGDYSTELNTFLKDDDRVPRRPLL